jgi:phosphoribosylformylglycinamidine cyclo-ligase
MENRRSGLRYRDAGVDIDAAAEALGSVKALVRETFNENVLQDLGSFGAMYALDMAGMEEPVLVSSVDGVGTKLKLAFMTRKHDTVGIDLVSHCVNDILVQGAKPLFFLDYLAIGRLEPGVVADVIRGLATGCRQSGLALIGGETAEMPDMYAPGEYDLAGTIVGIADRKRIIDGSKIAEGDVIIGLPSSGLHTNGYSLARKICFEVAGLRHGDEMPGTGRSTGDVLLEPHLSYAQVMWKIMAGTDVRGMAHITGGGITDNLPRVLPDDLSAEIRLGAWTVPPVFRFLRDTGNVEEAEMLRTFNNGIGMLFIVPADAAETALEKARATMHEAVIMGNIIPGDGTVVYTGSLNYGGAD